MTAVPALSSSHSPHYLNMSTGSEYFRGGLGLGSTGEINTPYATATATAARPMGANSSLGQLFMGQSSPLGAAAKSPVTALPPQSNGPMGTPAKHWSQMDTLFTRHGTKPVEPFSPVNATQQSNVFNEPAEAVKSSNQNIPDKSPEALKIVPPASGEKWQLVRESLGSISGERRPSLGSISGERRPSWGSPKPKQRVGSSDAAGSVTPGGAPLTPARTPARTSAKSPPTSPRTNASSKPMTYERTALEAAAAASLNAESVNSSIVQDALMVGGGGSSSQMSSHATIAATAAPSSLPMMIRTDTTEHRDPSLQSPFGQNNNNINNSYNNNTMSMGTGMRSQQPWSPATASNTSTSMYMTPNLVPTQPLLPYKSVESSIQLIGISGSHGAQVTPLDVY